MPPFTLLIALFIVVWPHQAIADPLPQHDVLPGENPTVCGSRCEEPNAPCSYPGDDGAIRIETALHQGGGICVRVENATDVALFHGIPGAPGRTDLRVERHVRAGRWRRAAPTVQLFFTLAYRSPWLQTVAPHSYPSLAAPVQPPGPATGALSGLFPVLAGESHRDPDTMCTALCGAGRLNLPFFEI